MICLILCTPKHEGCRPEGVGAHIRQITRAGDTTDMYHANSRLIACGRLIIQANMRPSTEFICIDQLVKFDYTTNVVTTFVNMNRQVLRKIQLSNFTSILKPPTFTKHL